MSFPNMVTDVYKARIITLAQRDYGIVTLNVADEDRKHHLRWEYRPARHPNNAAVRAENRKDIGLG